MVDFSYADRISNKIINLVNEEKDKPEFDLAMCFCGLMLGTLGFLAGYKGSNPPDEMHLVRLAMLTAVRSMHREFTQPETRVQ